MKNILIRSNNSNELNYSFNDELDEGFIENFNEIFKFNNKHVKIVGTTYKSYFRGKDILDILGYNNDRGFTTKILSKIRDNNKSLYIKWYTIHIIKKFNNRLNKIHYSNLNSM
jgi:hypothetical protein